MLRTRGLTPVATMASLLYSDIKKNGVNSRFVKICKGHYILRDQLDTLPLTITQPVEKNFIEITTVQRLNPNQTLHIKYMILWIEKFG